MFSFLGLLYLRINNLATFAQRFILSISNSIRSVYAKKINAHMTPKEKALEFTNKFTFNTRCFSETKGWEDSFFDAKQCALIAVDEIIKTIEYSSQADEMSKTSYWQEVKQEIQKL